MVEVSFDDQAASEEGTVVDVGVFDSAGPEGGDESWG